MLILILIKNTVIKINNDMKRELRLVKKDWIEKTVCSTSVVDELNNSELFLVMWNSYGA